MKNTKYLTTAFIIIGLFCKIMSFEVKQAYSLKVITDFNTQDLDEIFFSDFMPEDIIRSLRLNSETEFRLVKYISDSIFFKIESPVTLSIDKIKPVKISDLYEIVELREENKGFILNFLTSKLDLKFDIKDKSFDNSMLSLYSKTFVDKFFEIKQDNALISKTNGKLKLNSYIADLYERKFSGLYSLFGSHSLSDLICEKINVKSKGTSPFKINSFYLINKDSMIFRTSINDKFYSNLKLHTVINNLDSSTKELLEDNKIELILENNEINFSDGRLIAFSDFPYICNLDIDSSETIDLKFTIFPQETVNKSLRGGDRFFKYFFDMSFNEFDFVFEQPRGYKLNNCNEDSLHYKYTQTNSIVALDLFEMEPLIAFYIDLSVGSLSTETISNYIQSATNKDNLFIFLTNGEDSQYGGYEKLMWIRKFDPIKTPNTFMGKLNEFRRLTENYTFKSGINSKRRKFSINFFLSESTVDYNLKDARYKQKNHESFSNIVNSMKNNLSIKDISLFYPNSLANKVFKMDGINYIVK
ncbi:MAG: hypothetical protein JXR48_00185 [Candidatus Delongbacteria bacterium]|nr:hypothetical protein [Candidatus Delongbacteria bacterium]